MKISIATTILAPKKKVWDYYTLPEHITQWNFADPSWHCPSASNDMQIGGTYSARMEAKDGSFGFDFEAVYEEITPGNHFSYVMPDHRKITVDFSEEGEHTLVAIVFDAEDQNPVDMQRAGWQSILNNFKNYVQTH